MENSQEEAGWSKDTKTQLEEILLSNLDSLVKNAVKIISSYGYTEEVAMNAVLISGYRYASCDPISNTVEKALVMLEGWEDVCSCPRENLSEDLEKFERWVLADMVSLLMEVCPIITRGDAMWCLLICDMNIFSNRSVNLPSGSGKDESSDSPPAQLLGLGSNSRAIISPVKTTGSRRLAAMLPYHQNTRSETPTVLDIMSLYIRRLKAIKDLEKMLSNLKPMNGSPVTSSDNMDSSSPSATHSLQEEKPVNSQNVHVSSSKGNSIPRQKSIHFDKSCRGLGSKAAPRTSKHSESENLLLCRKCKSISDSSGKNLKTSLKVGKAMRTNASQGDATVNLSFSAGLTSSFGKNPVHSPPPNSMPNTELSVPLPSTRSSLISTKLDCNVEPPICSKSECCSYDKMCKDCVPRDKRDEMALKLVPYMKELQAQNEFWTNWAQCKVMQVVKRLRIDKAELQLLRKEKEERQNLEESTKKKHAEIEIAIMRAKEHVERANVDALRLEIENDNLMLEMEVAKLLSVQSPAKCQEFSWKEIDTVKMLQKREKLKDLLQEELVAEERKFSQLQQQLEKAKQHQDQLQTTLRQEEEMSRKALTLADSERKEQEHIEASAKSQENVLMLNRENELQRYKFTIRGLERKISKLRRILDPPRIAETRRITDKDYYTYDPDGRKDINAQVLAVILESLELPSDDVQHERECVMCLTEETSVVFLPCAHQVLCKECNELHVQGGMNDCPSCRTPIRRRVSVRFASSNVANTFSYL
ncbi:putative E3 ubiquitin-protein ligase RF298 [Typha latifolia]|uniref:putative E3 ubiquitin-protein ligase RF298 n=1 Tax=Typha latifolia TaxID=4733 RepID=UPI003C2C35AB